MRGTAEIRKFAAIWAYGIPAVCRCDKPKCKRNAKIWNLQASTAPKT